MPDDEHPLPFPAQRQIAEEATDTRDRLPPALAARIRLVHVLPLAHSGRWHPVALTVVPLPQPPVVRDRNVTSAEGDRHRLDSTA
jgi:hypothetical protein